MFGRMMLEMRALNENLARHGALLRRHIELMEQLMQRGPGQPSVTVGLDPRLVRGAQQLGQHLQGMGQALQGGRPPGRMP